MNIVVLGPAHPFRGGIAHHTTLLARHLRAAIDPDSGEAHALHLLTFARQYPDRLYPGRSDQDPSSEAVVEPAERILAPLAPLSWLRTARRIREIDPDLLVLQWWVPFWAPSIATMLFRLRWLMRRRGGEQRPRVLFICHNVLPHEGARFWTRWLVRAALWQGDAYLVHSESDEQTLRELMGKRIRPATGSSSEGPTGTVADGRNAAAVRDASSSPRGSAASEADSMTKEPRASGASVHRALLPLHTIAESVDPARARADLGLPPDARVLLFFGFVRPYKGLEFLIEALPACVARVPDLRLVVAGEFWTPVAEFEARAGELGVADRIVFDDRYVPNEDVGRYFSAADLLVMPYKSATQSGVVTLAVRFGLPIVATRVGGLPEVVLDGETGLIVPPADSAALAKAMGDVLSDEALRAQLSAGVEANAERFGWSPLIDRIVSIGRGEA